MKLEEIRKVARENKIMNYFKALYQHNIKILENVPEDRINGCLKGGYNIIPAALSFETDEDVEEDGRHSESLYIEVAYLESGIDSDCWNDFEIEYMYSEKTTCDYCGIRMILFLDDREETVQFEVDEEAFGLDYSFFKELVYDNFLKAVFGKYFVENHGEDGKKVCFRVSTKCFED